MATTSKHESKWRNELNRLKAAVETARESVGEAEREVRARKQKLRAIEDVHRETLDAWLRGDEDLPPRQAELFGDDQVEDVEALGRKIVPPPGEWTDRDHEEFERVLEHEYAKAAAVEVLAWYPVGDRKNVLGHVRARAGDAAAAWRAAREYWPRVETLDLSVGASVAEPNGLPGAARWDWKVRAVKPDETPLTMCSVFTEREDDVEGALDQVAKGWPNIKAIKLDPPRKLGAPPETGPKKSKAKLQGAARVPSATIQAADESERVGCKPTIEVDDRADGARAPTGPRPTIEVEPSAAGEPPYWQKPIDLCSLHPWRSTPIKAVVKGADLVAMLRETEVKTLGDLHDACELCGGAANAFEDLGPIQVAAIEHDVRAWARSHPGFPLEVLDRPAPPRSEQIDDELHAALYPAGFDPGWLKCRSTGGLSNIAAARKLADIWPERADFRSDTEDGPGHTVRGGDRPAFWLGELAPGSNPPADLDGPELYDAIRRVLELPKLSADDVDPMEAAQVREEIGDDAPGPDRIEGAVGAALCHLRSETLDKLRKGATDAEISAALCQLPTACRKPTRGKPWAVRGGYAGARLYFGDDVAAWPDPYKATLAGDALIAMVRKVGKIPQPKPRKAAKPKPKEAVR